MSSGSIHVLEIWLYINSVKVIVTVCKVVLQVITVVLKPGTIAAGIWYAYPKLWKMEMPNHGSDNFDVWAAANEWNAAKKLVQLPTLLRRQTWAIYESLALKGAIISRLNPDTDEDHLTAHEQLNVFKRVVRASVNLCKVSISYWTNHHLDFHWNPWLRASIPLNECPAWNSCSPIQLVKSRKFKSLIDWTR